MSTAKRGIHIATEDIPAPAIVYHAGSGELIEWNAEAAEFFGIKGNSLHITSLQPDWNHSDTINTTRKKIKTIFITTNGREELDAVKSYFINDGIPCCLAVFQQSAERRHEQEIQELNRSLADFQNAIHRSSIVSRTDNAGKIIFVNENFIRISGYSEGELIGQNHRIINSGYHPAQFWACMWKTISSGDVWRADVKNRAKDGSYYWVDTFVMPFLDKNGRIREYLSIRNDITERKQTELALEHSLSSMGDSFDYRFEKFAAHLPGFIFQYRMRPNGTTHLPFASREIEKIFGVSAISVREDASSIFEVMHPDDRERVVLAMRRSAESLEQWHDEYRVIHKSGKVIWVEGVSTPQRLPDGSTLWNGYLNDITQRKEAELLIKESRDRYLGIIEHLPGFVFRLNPNTNTITFINGEVQEITGYQPEDFLLHGIGSWREKIYPEDLPQLTRTIENALANASSYECEYRIKTREGEEKWIWERGKGHNDENGMLSKVDAFASDITAQKRAEEKIRQSLKEKESLVKEIHHRVKNNLQVISSIIYLKSAGLENAELKSFLEDTRQKIRAISLIHERLLETETVSDIEISGYLRKLIRDVERLHFKDESNIIITADIQKTHVNLDHAVYCGLILNELVTNSVKHAFAGTGDPVITIKFSETDSGYNLLVTDNGCGLPPEISPGKTSTFGMQLLHIFLNQLHADYSITRTKGTQFHMNFPAASGNHP